MTNLVDGRWAISFDLRSLIKAKAQSLRNDFLASLFLRPGESQSFWSVWAIHFFVFLEAFWLGEAEGHTRYDS